MATARRKYRISLLVMVILVAGIWGTIAAVADCETQTVAAPSPTASATPTSSPTPTPTSTASPSPTPTATPATTTREVCKRPLEPRLGLDLQGGISVVLTAQGDADPDSIDKAVEIIRNRVDALGVAEPDISRQGENVLVQLPGIKEQSKAIQIIGTTAQLRFRPVLEELQPSDPNYAA